MDTTAFNYDPNANTMSVVPSCDYTLTITDGAEDGWFGESVGPHQHFSHSIFRSIEEGKNVIRSANNGISGYIN